MKRWAVVVAALAGVGLPHAVAVAATVTGNWDIRDQQGMAPGDFFDPAWTVPVNETVQVTGLYVLGDNYAVFDNGALVASTNAADYTMTGNGPFGAPYTVDPSVAWATT